MIETKAMDDPHDVDVANAFVVMLKGFLEQKCPIAVVRNSGSRGFDLDLWQAALELGLLEVALDRSGAGGMGVAGQISGALGRRLAPVPFIETCIAARALERAGNDAALEDVLVGGRAVTVDLRGPAADGSRQVVLGGGPPGDVIALVDGDLVMASIAEAEPIPNLASLPLVRIELGSQRTVLATGDAAGYAAARIHREWQVLTAAALSGLAAEAMVIGADYVKERVQFGVKIGSFQAVQHRLADIATELAGVERLVVHAVRAAVQDDARADRLAAMAFAASAEVAREASSTALHYHGGYGYTLEYDIHLYFIRAKGWPLTWDSPANVFASIGASLLDDGANGVRA
jgi:alkylation response protein AidB-like acyl-CoA dehydrogenase